MLLSYAACRKLTCPLPLQNLNVENTYRSRASPLGQRGVHQILSAPESWKSAQQESIDTKNCVDIP